MQLIINADDFGLTKATNEAVFELAKLGTVSSTTVMVNMLYASEAVKLTGIHGFGVGLHFNLTQGRPLSNPELIPSLVKENGCFLNITTLKKKIKNNEISKAEVLIELNAQFSRLENIIGSNISHIDSHQDINKQNLISDTLIEFMVQRKNPLGLRWYNKTYLYLSKKPLDLIEPGLMNLSKFGLKRFVTERYFRLIRNKLLHSFKLPDAMLYTENHNIRTLLQRLTMLESINTNKVFEIMVHPATSTEEFSETNMLEARVEEYNILKSFEFQEFIQKNSLLTFADLKK